VIALAAEVTVVGRAFLSAVDRLAKQGREAVLDVASGAVVEQRTGAGLRQPCRVIEVAAGEKTGVGTDPGPVKLQLDGPVKPTRNAFWPASPMGRSAYGRVERRYRAYSSGQPRRALPKSHKSHLGNAGSMGSGVIRVYGSPLSADR
jgi:hypothetical protein